MLSRLILNRAASESSQQTLLNKLSHLWPLDSILTDLIFCKSWLLLLLLRNNNYYQINFCNLHNGVLVITWYHIHVVENSKGTINIFFTKYPIIFLFYLALPLNLYIIQDKAIFWMFLSWEVYCEIVFCCYLFVALAVEYGLWMTNLYCV